MQKRAKPTVEKRRSPRRPRRLSCEFWLAGARHTGIVKDVSEKGLYVQTRAKATPGTRVALVFAAEKDRPEVRVVARVVRTDRIHAHFATTSAGGLGVEVLEATRELATLLADAGFAAPRAAGSGAR